MTGALPDSGMEISGALPAKKSVWRSFLRLWDRTAIYLPRSSNVLMVNLCMK